MHRQTQLDGRSSTGCGHEEATSPTPQFSYLKNGDSDTDLTLSSPWVECSVQAEEFCQSYCEIVFGYFKLQKLLDT